MKQFLFGTVLLMCSWSWAQKKANPYAIEASVLRGNVLLHSPYMAQFITGHPDGFMLTYAHKTTGQHEWESTYNFPDYGLYFLYQDFKNPLLGYNSAVGGFYKFYFANRHLSLKIAQGLAMTTNPYDRVTNSKNRAFGSRFMGNTNFMFGYTRDKIVGNLGLDVGLFFTHYSNGRFKSPNSGVNTYGINLGVHYDMNPVALPITNPTTSSKFREPIKYNFILRTGVNESPSIGSGQKPFYHVGAYADKRLGRKSALQLGTEVFFTLSNQEYIRYKSIAFPELNIDPNTDYKRVGVFVGHELFINRLSFEAQLGYYVYQPYKLDISMYDRIGIKYYFTKNCFTGVGVKTHGLMAEATEFALGIRL
ncbi:MAG: hypothetical protein RL699_1013 [Bacteroidota bacterium]